jgi:hypothetical protein
MICNSGDALARVIEFDFDLNDLQFVHYFIGRTGYDILEADCGWEKKREMILNPSHADERWQQIERGKIQDCWELYRGRRCL